MLELDGANKRSSTYLAEPKHRVLGGEGVLLESRRLVSSGNKQEVVQTTRH